MNLRLGDNIPNLERIEAGSQVNLRSLTAASSLMARLALCFCADHCRACLLRPIMSSGGYLLQSLVEEKQTAPWRS